MYAVKRLALTVRNVRVYSSISHASAITNLSGSIVRRYRARSLLLEPNPSSSDVIRRITADVHPFSALIDDTARWTRSLKSPA